MERIKELNRFQKAVLILLSVMMIVFAVLYPVVYARVGFAYADHILVPGEDNGSTTYSARIRGKDAVFTVTADRTVTFHYGDRVYGPYTAREDPTAVPEDSAAADLMTGVEIREGEEIWFRGVAFPTDDGFMVMSEDGSAGFFTITYTQGDGTVLDMNGDPVDEMEPSVSAVLELMDGPALTRKGEWAAWFCGMLVCIATAVSILFADELFRWHISFRVQDPDSAEPSDFEIAGRYISWTLLPAMALFVFILGLL